MRKKTKVRLRGKRKKEKRNSLWTDGVSRGKKAEFNALISMCISQGTKKANKKRKDKEETSFSRTPFRSCNIIS